MSYTTPRSTVRIGAPFFPVVLAIAVVCFGGTLLTDLAYWKTAVMMWADFSAWLITSGVIFGYIAVVVWIVDMLRGPLIRAQMPPWPYAIANLVALVIATFDMLIHTRDAWTSVVPWGLVLSALAAVIIVVAGGMGRMAVDRGPIAVRQPGVAP